MLWVLLRIQRGAPHTPFTARVIPVIPFSLHLFAAFQPAPLSSLSTSYIRCGDFIDLFVYRQLYHTFPEPQRAPWAENRFSLFAAISWEKLPTENAGVYLTRSLPRIERIALHV